MAAVSQTSFFGLWSDALTLLSPKQRVRGTRHVIRAVLLALMEVVSVTAVVPLFYAAMENDASRGIAFLPAVITWPVLLSALVVVFLLKNTYAVWLVRRQLQFASDLYTALAEQLYRSFFRQAWKNYVNESSAETYRKIKNTPFEFTNNVLLQYLNLICDVIICALITAVMLYIDYRIIFALGVLTLPLILFYMRFRRNVIVRLDRSFRDLTPVTSIALSQGINSFAEARIYKKENFFVRRFLTLSKTTVRLLADLKTFATVPPRILETIAFLCLGLLLVTAKAFPGFEASFMAIGASLFVGLYRIVPSLNRIMVSLSQIQSYAFTVYELKNNLESAGKVNDANLPPLSFESAIEIRRINFKYNSSSHHYILKDFSLTIKKGEFVLLDGPSGAGKSTLIHILAGLITDYGGALLVDDTRITPANVARWQSNLAIVPQAAVILQDTLYRNIAFGVEDNQIDAPMVNRAVQLAGLEGFIHSLPAQLHTPVGENGLTLSGGQRQRLALARALYTGRNVLLLDEVTNNLDRETKLEVLKNLQLLAESGKTIIITSHDATVREFATRTVRMDANSPVQLTPRGEVSR